MNKVYRGHKDLKVYQLAFKAAMDIFQLTKSFPDSEKHALTRQIRNSSRSVAANIAEGYRKRIYPKSFKSKMVECDGECAETKTWIDFAIECEYITIEDKNRLDLVYDEIGRMLCAMIENPERFVPHSQRSN
jgi:four helix bundle protein